MKHWENGITSSNQIKELIFNNSLGTISLLAAIDLLTGEAIPLVSDTHKSSDFVTFLKILDEINAVPVPYKWKYKMDTIHLETEDISRIIYEVVNEKAAGTENQGKRAPIPTQRKKKGQKQNGGTES